MQHKISMANADPNPYEAPRSAPQTLGTPNSASQWVRIPMFAAGGIIVAVVVTQILAGLFLPYGNIEGVGVPVPLILGGLSGSIAGFLQRAE